MDWKSIKVLADLLFHHYPKAYAQVKGSSMYPDIEGGVFFYETMMEHGEKGIFVVTEITGFPYSGRIRRHYTAHTEVAETLCFPPNLWYDISKETNGRSSYG